MPGRATPRSRGTVPVPHGDGVVTGLIRRRAGLDRVAVYLDGTYAFDINSVLAERESLQVDRVLSGSDQERLLQEDTPHRARDKALRLLGLRERSGREIELKLQAAGFEPPVITDTIEWLQSLGYLDDRRFVARYTAEKQKQGWGERRIAVELLRKGIDRRIIEESRGAEVAAKTLGGAADAVEAVTVLARKKFGRQFATDPASAARRLTGFMARRGYDWEDIRKVTRTLATEASHGEAADPSETWLNGC